jgi:hypothetical protein
MLLLKFGIAQGFHIVLKKVPIFNFFAIFRGIESPAEPRETNVYGPLPTYRFTFLQTE